MDVKRARVTLPTEGIRFIDIVDVSRTFAPLSFLLHFVEFAFASFQHFFVCVLYCFSRYSNVLDIFLSVK